MGAKKPQAVTTKFYLSETPPTRPPHHPNCVCPRCTRAKSPPVVVRKNPQRSLWEAAAKAAAAMGADVVTPKPPTPPPKPPAPPRGPREGSEAKASRLVSEQAARTAREIEAQHQAAKTASPPPPGGYRAWLAEQKGK